MKLISMTDFVLNSYEHFKSPTLFEETVFKYATFLKQPLKLGMFIPCDENDNILNENEWKKFTGKMEDFHFVAIKYDKAKSKVIFSGFDVIKKSTYLIIKLNDKPIWISWDDKKTIEDVLVPLNVNCAVSF